MQIALVFIRVKPEMVRRGDMLSVSDVLEILSIPLLGVVPEDGQVLISSNRGVPLTLDSQKTPASDAFHNIARRLNGEDVPLMDLEQQRRGLLRRLVRLFRGSRSAV